MPLRDNRTIGALKATAVCVTTIPFLSDASGKVAEVVLIQTSAAAFNPVDASRILPHTSQSPAVKLMLVKFVAVALLIDVADPAATLLVTNSPTFPAAALSFVVVPTIPPVVGLKVMEEVVNAGNVVPQAGTPEPLVTNIELLAVGSAAITFALDA